MHYYEVAPLKIVRAGSDTLTYASDMPLAVGALVLIEVGQATLVGLVVEQVERPSYATKPITRRIEDKPLPAPLVATTRWIATYYCTPLATTLQTVLPRGLEKTRRAGAASTPDIVRDRTKYVFTQDQARALEQLSHMKPGTALLHGVTGSGKTAVYIEMAKRTLAAGRSVIVLVPEIALTSQLVAEFSHHFDAVTLTHSRQTEAQRHTAWQTVLRDNTPRVVIGPRSALFMPLASVGLIVIDECHEPSFKQEQSPRYSALGVAGYLREQHGAKLILGSATPLVSDYYALEHTGQPIITLSTPARRDTVRPAVTLVDMTKRSHFTKHRFLSDDLLRELEATFARGDQALVFHNRRGSASTTLCEACGWNAGCPRCYVPLTLHADRHTLRCHICDLTSPVPTSCPTCGSVEIIHKGIGTKLIESELRKLFPKVAMVRFDGDSALDETVERRYSELYSGDIQLIVGTQVIAKGLDLPKLRTVGVVQADAGLSLPDFGASERTFQLLAQVIGRVGRSHHPTNVIIQSYQPSHPAVIDGLTQRYDDFYQRTLALRKHTHFPPFRYLLRLTCSYRTEAAAIKNARQLAAILRERAPADTEILGPTPAFYERQRDSYRWQLLVKSPRRSHLADLLDAIPKTHWQFELDPLSLL